MTNSSDHQEFSAPKRPKLWLLRTRRFWFGIWVLFLLLGAWIGAGQVSGTIHYISPHRGQRPGSVVFGFQHGNVIFSWRSEIISCANDWSAMWENKVGYDAWPSLFEFGDLKDPKDLHFDLLPDLPVKSCNLNLPLWLPVLLWLIVWPLWIRRITRKEAAHFAKLQ